MSFQVTIKRLPNTPSALNAQETHICYSFQPTRFGEALLASLHDGLCHVAFITAPDNGLSHLQSLFPQAILTAKITAIQKTALDAMRNPATTRFIKAYVRGSDFQLAVWKALVQIPRGHRSTYGAIATQVGAPNAYRAAGTAIGNNPIAFFIPCHRVVPASGALGSYRWGSACKQRLLDDEAALDVERSP